MLQRTRFPLLALIALTLSACGGGQAPEPPAEATSPADQAPADAAPPDAAAEEPADVPVDPFARSTSPDAVIGLLWQWVGSTTPDEDIAVSEPERYLLLLNAEGRAEVEFDCNSGGGDYTIDEAALSFGPLISTRMACPEDTQDFVYMSQLQRASAFYVENGELYVELAMDGGTMRFVPVAEFE
ncbi:MAG: META domain-containing protein [Gammaproteobacteria bacterium]|nr:META domain-containing protein [Gammaproteobacteria bacterium]MDH4256467.1 META domain-containing protein [Gammaproteobacteria bacterium]MDH5311244.1 META domain-containing protein [Gammaproteobacteria bacterium]